MSNIVVRGRVKPQAGKEEQLLQWMNDLCRVVREGEPDTTSFAFYRDPVDGSFVVIEQYPSSEAVLAHMANAGPTIRLLRDLVDPTGDPLEVYGDLSEEANEAWKAFRPALFPLVASR